MGVQADSLGGFYKELSAQGVEVLDLRPAFTAREAAAEAMYCKTDSHWSGRGCVVAAQLVAERVRALLPQASPGFQAQWKDFLIRGDLEELAQRRVTDGETLPLRQVSDAGGKALSSDPASPLLLIGDSHTLVFRDFQGERAGLLDQLALETGIVPEVIGTRGSGANAVRLSLFRRNLKDPKYLSSKKVLVWCFAAREFTEADQGWQLIPLSRAEVRAK
jgi:alginate O-acetyltransferase complex protein AlgJ